MERERDVLIDFNVIQRIIKNILIYYFLRVRNIDKFLNLYDLLKLN